MQNADARAGHAPLLEARGLSKNYGDTRALDSLDLAIAPGEVFCLLGPNGAGKTTTINLFLGFVAPSAGQALVSGLDVSEHDRKTKQRLAYIPEQVMLYRNLSGLENLEYFAALGGKGSLGRERLTEILVEAGLEQDAVDRRVSQVLQSACGRRSALRSRSPRRPTPCCSTSRLPVLDPKASNEFSALVERLRKRGVAVLMATHDLFRAKDTGTRVGYHAIRAPWSRS